MSCYFVLVWKLLQKSFIPSFIHSLLGSRQNEYKL